MEPDFEYGHHVVGNFLLAVVILVIVNLNHWFEYQFAPIMYLIPSFGMMFLWYVDKFILKSSNTFTEIVTKGNVAYAIWMLCFTLLVLAGVCAAFLLYFSYRVGDTKASADHAALGGSQGTRTEQRISDGRSQQIRWEPAGLPALCGDWVSRS